MREKVAGDNRPDEGRAAPMSPTILLFLAQDGVMNGAVYALLGVALVLLFTVTRVIFVAQGEFVAWAALTVAALENGALPGTAKLLVGLGLAAAAVETLRPAGAWPLDATR